MQAFLFTVLEPIFRSSPEATALLTVDGELAKAGETVRFPELGDLLERLGREGPRSSTTATWAAPCRNGCWSAVAG